MHGLIRPGGIVQDRAAAGRILIVDDSPDSIRLLAEVLKDEYAVLVATGAEQAERRLAQTPRPDLILLDVVMPGIDGYELCARVKRDPALAAIPVIFLSALGDDSSEAKGLEIGAVDYVSKPCNPAILRQRIRNQLELKAYRDGLELMVRERTREIETTRAVTFASLGGLAEYRDTDTGNHIQRCSAYVRLLAERLAERGAYAGAIGPAEVETLALSAPLHDIGKVAIPDAILLKPGRLDEAETKVMRRHAYMGYRALERAARGARTGKGGNSFLDAAMDMAYSHHERWDGAGYPRGLSGESIPLAGRIMAIADVYDALRSRRPYKGPMGHAEALALVAEGSGAAFDPLLAATALELGREFERVAEELADGEEAR